MDIMFIIIGFGGGVISFVTFAYTFTSRRKIGTVFLLLAIGLLVMGFVGVKREADNQQVFIMYCEQLLEEKNVVQYLKDNC